MPPVADRDASNAVRLYTTWLLVYVGLGAIVQAALLGEPAAHIAIWEFVVTAILLAVRFHLHHVLRNPV